MSLDIDTYLGHLANRAWEHGFQRHLVASAGSSDAIWAWTRGARNADAPHVVLSAGIHGDEPAGPLAVLRLLQQDYLASYLHWTILPVLNPTGLRRGNRFSEDGLDLNRDFLRRASPEVRGLTAWWEQQARRCDLHLSLHEDWEATGFYLYEINTSPGASLGRGVLEALGPGGVVDTQAEADGHTFHEPGLIEHAPFPDEPQGWPEAIWLVRRHPCQSLTFEAPSSHPLEDRVEVLRTAVRTALNLHLREQARVDLQRATRL